MLNDQAIHLSVEASTTIEDVKLDIQRRVGYPTNQLRLVLGRQLADDETMDECHIQRTHNVLYLVLLGSDGNPKAATRKRRQLLAVR
jgi:hypothetical protein